MLVAAALSCATQPAIATRRSLPVAPILLSDDRVRQTIIKTSIAIYSGDCACPYSIAAKGRRCGGRSMWSRHGDFDVTCYPDEVGKAEIREWRARHRQVPLPKD